MKKLIVNFERPKEDGFDSARCELPDYKWTERQGYSDEEIAMFEELLHSNAHLLYRYTENRGGIGVKKDGQKQHGEKKTQIQFPEKNYYQI